MTVDALLRVDKPDDFAGCASLLQTLRSRLATPGPGAVLLVGPSGCGKSSLCSLLFAEANAEVSQLGTDEVAAEGARGLQRRLETLRDTRSVISFFCPRRHVLFLEDVDAMHCMDRLVQGTLLAFVREPAFATAHVLLIMTACDERKLTELKRRVEVLHMSHPHPIVAYAHIKQRLEAASGVPLSDPQKEQLEATCRAMHGAVRSSVLQYTAGLEADGGAVARQSNNTEVRLAHAELQLRDAGMYDVLGQVLSGHVAARDSDVLLGYDPTVLALLYYDNVARHIAGEGGGGVLDTKRRLAWQMHHMHVLECNNLFGGDMVLGDVTSSLRCKLMCVDAEERKAAVPTKAPEYAFTQVLARTAQKYHVEKRTHALLQELGLGSGGGGRGVRECYYDACSHLLRTQAAHSWAELAGGSEHLGEQLRQLAAPYCEHVVGVAKAKLLPRAQRSRKK